MKVAKLNRVIVTDSRAAAVFTDPRLRRLLMWFVRHPASVGDAAIAWEMDPRRAHYYVQRLERLGLLRVVAVRARAGRPIKSYRAAGDSFFVPNHAVPKEYGDELSRELRESISGEFSQSDGGMLCTAALNGSPRLRIVRSRKPAKRAQEFWRVLDLHPDDVSLLAHEITALFNRYQRAPAPIGGQTYLVHAAIARRLDQDGMADNSRKRSKSR
jgi:hypothetical protein